MRQLPRILLLTCVTTTIIVALLVSVLRLAMPMLNHWREPIFDSLSALTGMKIDASHIDGHWENFGPSLEIRDLSIALNDGGSLSVSRVSLALNVWRSLLHFRWQFRDLTFYHLDFNTNTPLIISKNEDYNIQLEHLNYLFLHQFDHFVLRDSRLSFPAPSGQRLTLMTPQLSCLNERERHRVEGEVNLSSLNGQHGVLQVRMDLRDSHGLLNDGRIWLQADDLDIRPWMGEWMHDNTHLEDARLSLATWINLKEGEVYSGDLLLKRGKARWQGVTKTHTLQVENQTAHLEQFSGGWRLNLPQLAIKTDSQRWPSGQLDMLWQPPGAGNSGEFRLRGSQLDLARIKPLVSLAAGVPRIWVQRLEQLNPDGQIDRLALDIPLKQPEQTRFDARWHNLSWNAWKQLPAMRKLDGEASGSLANGALKLMINRTTLPWNRVFKAPLQIDTVSGRMNWQYGPQGLVLNGHDVDVQMRALKAHGNFAFSHWQNAAPHLAILGSIDASDAWRYFPKPLMEQSLKNYLTSALKGGTARGATLLFDGNPEKFPFKQQEGTFQVSVPLRNATFAFQQDWPTISGLNIDLNFTNNGLWMNAPVAMLGKIYAKQISAKIPDYSKSTLLIDGRLHGAGQDIRQYFYQTALRTSLGKALDQLQVSGEVSSRLHLAIPLDGPKGKVYANGKVTMEGSRLFIKPIATTLNNVHGNFRFKNGNLQSDTLRASLYSQPVMLRFNTSDGDSEYRVGVNFKGNWALNKVSMLPVTLRSALAGSASWQADVAVCLPHSGNTRYQGKLTTNLQDIASNLPPPFDKQAGSVMPVTVSVQGDDNGLDVSGSAGSSYYLNSHWLLNRPLRIERGIWLSDGQSVPALPNTPGVKINLPPTDGDSWLALITDSLPLSGGRRVDREQQHATFWETEQHYYSWLPESLSFYTPSLKLAGQHWRTLTTTISKDTQNNINIRTKGREINGTLKMSSVSPWQLDLGYLYYNPQWADSDDTNIPLLDDITPNRFRYWPVLKLTCSECWLRGQNFGLVQATLTPAKDKITLTDGLIDTGNIRMQTSGEWVKHQAAERTLLKGKLSGKKSDDAMNWLGIYSPLRAAPFDIDYDLNWRSVPWKPSVETLSGTIKSHFGPGQIVDVDTGKAGQILSLFSVESLIRRIRHDFSDSFNKGFAFEAINGTGWIEDGLVHTNNLLIKSAQADVAIKGTMDLVHRQLNAQAVIAPEISSAVGIATAFAINPVAGAVVFAASKALGPLWSKISVLRYQISGPIDAPVIRKFGKKTQAEVNVGR